MPTKHKRTCNLCEANCGIIIETEGRKVLSVKGNPDHVLSGGYICPKATAIPDIQDDPDRLRTPLKRVGDEWHEISFEQAFAEIGERFAAITSGAKRASLYLGNPSAHNYGITMQMRVLFKTLELRGLYSASTLDQLPHMLAQKWVYGHSSLSPVADIDRTDYMLIIGGNPAASNGSYWTVPNARGRMKNLRKRGGKLVVIDPRRTETADLADDHHFIKPGTDTALLIGLLLALKEADLVNPRQAADYLNDNWSTLWSSLEEFTIAEMAAHCGVSENAIREIAHDLGQPGPAIVYGRMGVSVTQFGTLNHWLIQMLNIAAGNLDREGGILFNAPVIDPVENNGTGSYARFTSRVSNQPEVLGELPVVELADDITIPGDGQIGALFTIAGNPVLSSPDGCRLDEALAQLDLMVSIDFYRNETTRHAHYILPPCGPLEKDHYPFFLAPLAVRNYTCYSPPLFDKEPGTRADWEIIYGMCHAINSARGLKTPDVVEPRAALAHLLEKSTYDLTLDDLDAAPDGIDFGELKPSLPGRLKTEDGKINCAPTHCLEDLEITRILRTASHKNMTRHFR